MSGENLVLELNAKMLLTSWILGFLNVNISKTIGGIKLFLHAGTYIYIYILKLQIDDVILHDWGQACPGIPKEAINTLQSQKLLRACSFISIKVIN